MSDPIMDGSKVRARVTLVAMLLANKVTQHGADAKAFKERWSRGMVRQVMAASLAAVLAVSGSPILFAQQGAISGKATDEARRPYPDYSVRVREPQTGQLAATQPLATDGTFTVTGLTLGQRYIVELVNGNRVVCTEGPYNLNQGRTSISNVNIDCGLNPNSLWILAAAAGLTAGAASGGGDPAQSGVPSTFSVLDQSNSR